MDPNTSGGFSLDVSPSTLSNGYILPRGMVTPNALFVGGIDLTFTEKEIEDVFGRYGSVKEVKIITDRRGIPKGYGFVYFNGSVNIPSLIEQRILLKGRKLKLGPAIMKERIPRAMLSHCNDPNQGMSPSQCRCFMWYPPMGQRVTQPPPVLNGGSPYSQMYAYNNLGGPMVPLIPMDYAIPPNPYPYQLTPPPSMPYTPAPWVADQMTQPVTVNQLQIHVDAGVQTMPLVV